MNAIDEARRLLDMAQKDFKAMQGMNDAVQFPDEIYGFHAQQAVEKTLKAWLTLLECEYPSTHDISLLLHLLENRGVSCDKYFVFSD